MPAAPLPDHSHDFLASIGAERGLSPNTVLAYRRDLAQYAETIAASDGVVDATTVQKHMALMREKGLADTSIARKYASIRSYHRFLVIEGLSTDDPTVGIGAPQRPSSIPKALSIDEIALILDQPDTTNAIGRRDSAVLEMLYATGCRVSELTAVDQLDVDPETRTVLLTGKGNKQRLVPLGSYALSAIERWLPDRLAVRKSMTDTGALFLTVRGNRMSRQSVWRLVKQYGAAAGVDAGRLSPHVFRHSAATHMVEGGADLRSVQEMLGHASLSTTQLYTKVSPEHLREVLITSHPRGA
jgi:integrase/recombinase XerD